VESSMKVSQKNKKRTSIQSSNPTPRHVSEGM
jgi:hypothetical protein